MTNISVVYRSAAVHVSIIHECRCDREIIAVGVADRNSSNLNQIEFFGRHLRAHVQQEVDRSVQARLARCLGLRNLSRPL